MFVEFCSSVVCLTVFRAFGLVATAAVAVLAWLLTVRVWKFLAGNVDAARSKLSEVEEKCAVSEEEARARSGVRRSAEEDLEGATSERGVVMVLTAWISSLLTLFMASSWGVQLGVPLLSSVPLAAALALTLGGVVALLVSLLCASVSREWYFGRDFGFRRWSFFALFVMVGTFACAPATYLAPAWAAGALSEPEALSTYRACLFPAFLFAVAAWLTLHVGVFWNVWHSDRSWCECARYSDRSLRACASWHAYARDRFLFNSFIAPFSWLLAACRVVWLADGSPRLSGEVPAGTVGGTMWTDFGTASHVWLWGSAWIFVVYGTALALLVFRDARRRSGSGDGLVVAAEYLVVLVALLGLLTAAACILELSSTQWMVPGSPYRDGTGNTLPSSVWERGTG